jgi:hypothetical protein
VPPKITTFPDRTAMLVFVVQAVSTETPGWLDQRVDWMVKERSKSSVKETSHCPCDSTGLAARQNKSK